MSVVFCITCAECEENVWNYLKKGWGEFRKHNCFGQGPMCRECTMHAEHHACSCSSELGYAEEVVATFVDMFVAPLLMKEETPVSPLWSPSTPLYDPATHSETGTPFAAPWTEEDDAAIMARHQEEIDRKNRLIILRNLHITAQHVALSILQ